MTWSITGYSREKCRAGLMHALARCLVFQKRKGFGKGGLGRERGGKPAQSKCAVSLAYHRQTGGNAVNPTPPNPHTTEWGGHAPKSLRSGELGVQLKRA